MTIVVVVLPYQYHFFFYRFHWLESNQLFVEQFCLRYQFAYSRPVTWTQSAGNFNLGHGAYHVHGPDSENRYNCLYTNQPYHVQRSHDAGSPEVWAKSLKYPDLKYPIRFSVRLKTLWKKLTHPLAQHHAWRILMWQRSLTTTVTTSFRCENHRCNTAVLQHSLHTYKISPIPLWTNREITQCNYFQFGASDRYRLSSTERIVRARSLQAMSSYTAGREPINYPLPQVLLARLSPS